MPPKSHGPGPEKKTPASDGPASAKSVRLPKKSPSTGGERRVVNALRGSDRGLAPREAIREWLVFAKAKGCRLVTGKRQFNSDLDRVDTILEEEKSLFEFCRHKGIGLSEKLSELVKGPATREGFEHRVFYHLKNDPPRVTKITFPGKYGRIEHTPFLYLERLALFNELFPALDVRFEDCIIANTSDYSLVSSMRAFSGPPPTQEEIDQFLTSRRFSKLSSPSLTIDYTSHELGIHLRDCHPRNWVKSKDGLLIPIDIIPEIIV